MKPGKPHPNAGPTIGDDAEPGKREILAALLFGIRIFKRASFTPMMTITPDSRASYAEAQQQLRDEMAAVSVADADALLKALDL